MIANRSLKDKLIFGFFILSFFLALLLSGCDSVGDNDHCSAGLFTEAGECCTYVCDVECTVYKEGTCNCECEEENDPDFASDYGVDGNFDSVDENIDLVFDEGNGDIVPPSLN